MKECQCHRKFYQKLEVEAFYKKLSLRNENLWMYLVQTRHLKGPYADNFPLVCVLGLQAHTTMLHFSDAGD